MQIRSLGQEDPLEEKMATHSSILARKVPRTEKPSGLNGVTEDSDMIEWLHTYTHTHIINNCGSHGYCA